MDSLALAIIDRLLSGIDEWIQNLDDSGGQSHSLAFVSLPELTAKLELLLASRNKPPNALLCGIAENATRILMGKKQALALDTGAAAVVRRSDFESLGMFAQKLAEAIANSESTDKKKSLAQPSDHAPSQVNIAPGSKNVHENDGAVVAGLRTGSSSSVADSAVGLPPSSSPHLSASAATELSFNDPHDTRDELESAASTDAASAEPSLSSVPPSLGSNGPTLTAGHSTKQNTNKNNAQPVFDAWHDGDATNKPESSSDLSESNGKRKSNNHHQQRNRRQQQGLQHHHDDEDTEEGKQEEFEQGNVDNDNTRHLEHQSSTVNGALEHHTGAPAFETGYNDQSRSAVVSSISMGLKEQESSLDSGRGTPFRDHEADSGHSVKWLAGGAPDSDSDRALRSQEASLGSDTGDVSETRPAGRVNRRLLVEGGTDSVDDVSEQRSVGRSTGPPGDDRIVILQQGFRSWANSVISSLPEMDSLDEVSRLAETVRRVRKQSEQFAAIHTSASNLSSLQFAKFERPTAGDKFHHLKAVMLHSVKKSQFLVTHLCQQIGQDKGPHRDQRRNAFINFMTRLLTAIERAEM